MLFPKKYQSIIIACLLIIISLILLSYSVKKPSTVGFFRGLVLETAAPLANIITISFEGLSSAWKRYIFLVGLEEENKRLKKGNALLTRETVQYREAYLEGIRLQKLLALKEKVNYPMIAARVIARDQTSIIKTILINKGTSHGLRVDLPVLADQGVVGRIVEVSSHVSKILLLIDESSNVDALVQENRIQGILQGAGPHSCSLKYISKTETVNVGNIIISSGLSGLFPKGLLIGSVKSVDKTDSGLFQKINVEPFVDFARLEEVMVIVLNKDDEG
ncbi:MAG TPA: rod shape-determining protein MreC [Syntrophales bacterium]|nr:rod shape-determining protein MreC [Syntrophales bacterium]